MPPQHGDASDGRSTYDSRFKSKSVTLEDILQGAQPPLPWVQQLGPVYTCNKVLDAGGLGSLLSLAKKYPRAVCLVQDRPYLLCLKVDGDMELCSYKWLKKLVDITRVTRLQQQSFSRGTVDLAIEFNELDQDTGNNLEEILSFKAADADRFQRELDDARRAARKLQLELAASKAQGASGAATSSGTVSATAPPPPAPAPPAPVPVKQPAPYSAPAAPVAAALVSAPASVPPPAPQFDASFDDFGDFSAAPAAPDHAPAPAAPAAAPRSEDNPFADEDAHKAMLNPTAAPASPAPAADPFGDFSAPAMPAPTPSFDPFADLSDVKTALPPASQAAAPAGGPNLLDL